MKIFFLITAVLVISSSAQTDSPGALRIEREFNTFLKKDVAQVATGIQNLKNDITNEAKKYLSQYENLRTSVANKLKNLGAEGDQIAAKIGSQVDDFVNSLKERFANALSALDNVKSNLESNLVDPLRAQIEKLEDAVNNKPAAITCWDLYKQQLQGIFNTAWNKIRSAVGPEELKLKAKLQAIASNIKAELVRIEAEIRSSCGSNKQCVVQYVSCNDLNLL